MKLFQSESSEFLLRIIYIKLISPLDPLSSSLFKSSSNLSSTTFF